MSKSTFSTVTAISNSNHALELIISTTTTSVSNITNPAYKVLTSWLQTGASNQESVNVRLLRQIATVLFAHAASIDDPCAFGRFFGDGGREPFSDLGVDFLRLLGRGDFARTYGPVGKEGRYISDIGRQ